MNLHFVNHLSPVEYVEYGTLVMIISVVNSTGALGTEQLAFRQIKANSDKIIPISIVSYSLVASVLFSVVVLTLNLTDITGFFMIILLSLNMVLAAILRGLGFVNTSITTLNSYKIIMPIMIFTTWSLSLIKIMITIGVLGSILIAIYIFFKVKVSFYYERPRIKDIIPYFLALLSMSAMSYFDKIIVFINADASISSEFFLYSSTVLAPFAVIQVVMSSKLVYYYSTADSDFYDNKRLLNDYLYYLIIGVVLVLSILYLYVGHIKWSLVVVFVLTGIVRLIYSNYSSFISVNLSDKNHRFINFYSLTVVVFVFLLALTTISPMFLGIVFLGLWFSRVLIWYYVAQNT